MSAGRAPVLSAELREQLAAELREIQRLIGVSDGQIAVIRAERARLVRRQKAIEARLSGQLAIPFPLARASS